jgi:thioredoxin reductase/pSer/pThr/pTyr-binding forkhead associated (FHA) protein
MATKSRFIIRRKDSIVDDVFIESDGLTVGRLISNDLVLNHPAVSRTHAGITKSSNIPGFEGNAEDAERYWLFNLSSSNGTLLNGENVDNVLLFNDDVIQIGPYLIKVNYDEDALALTVELELKVQPLETRTAILQAPGSAGTSDKTMLIKMPSVAARGNTTLFSGQGLTGYLPARAQQALDLFWQKRKREAGKIEAKTPLHPRGGLSYGKAQFNWRPNFDLARLWRKSYFVWGTLGAVGLALVATAVYTNAFAPKPLSTAHATRFTQAALLNRNIARQSNSNSCTSCHTPTAGLLDRCIDCHQTQPTAQKAAFAPTTLIPGHLKQQLACTDCHIEHLGAAREAGLLDYGLCYNCHNGVYQIKQAGQIGPAGTILPIPHGGKLTGYPKIKPGGKGGEFWSLPLVKWQKAVERWKRKNPQKPLLSAERYSEEDSWNQFHHLHQDGGQNLNLCVVCHFNQAGARDIETSYGKNQAPRQACRKCHAEPEAATGLVRGLARCETCHQQHGQTEQIAALAPDDAGKIEQYLAQLGARAQNVNTFNLSDAAKRGGSAYALRHSVDAPTWRNFGALPWHAWLALLLLLPVTGLVFFAVDTLRRKYFWRADETAQAPIGPGTSLFQLTESQAKQKAEGPLFPRPVIDPLLCIGCHACVEACPHDVIAITADGVAAPVNVDQCMEDTSCQVECPTSPKACVVVHTAKKIPERQVPKRDQKFMTNVPGIYLIGDVSGVPLIKNAINEGGQVVEFVKAELAQEGAGVQADYDVAIIGMGPAGLSATVVAKQLGLRYLALEQDQVAATIQNTYGKGKFVFYKPDSVEARGGLPLMPDPLKKEGNFKEPMLNAWETTLKREAIKINERESCKDIQRENGVFRIVTEKGALKEPASYTARKVILSIGNRGTPMLLKVPGEELKMMVETVGIFCANCGTKAPSRRAFCAKCGEPMPPVVIEDSKVQYKLNDPQDYIGKKCIVVGAGNSAIEVAVALTGFERQGDKINFAPGAEVTLIVRSDLKGDLKLGNKMNFYDCLDAGKIKAYFRTTIKRIEPEQVILMDAKSEQEKTTIPCDYIFALIGGDKPINFLEKLGIEILGKRKKK